MVAAFPVGSPDMQLRCVGNNDVDMVVGTWQDGRIRTLRGIRKGKSDMGCLVFRDESIENAVSILDNTTRRGLVEKIIEFFQTGVAPVPLDETLEIISFLAAANESRAKDGEECLLTRCIAPLHDNVFFITNFL